MPWSPGLAAGAVDGGDGVERGSVGGSEKSGSGSISRDLFESQLCCFLAECLRTSDSRGSHFPATRVEHLTRLLCQSNELGRRKPSVVPSVSRILQSPQPLCFSRGTDAARLCNRVGDFPSFMPLTSGLDGGYSWSGSSCPRIC